MRPNLLSYNIVKVRALPLVLTFFLLSFLSFLPGKISASESIPLGVHILSTDELKSARKLTEVNEEDDRWTYVTIPFTLADVGQEERWQKFFDEAKELRVVPLVRLATRMDGDAWARPTYKDVVSQINFLAKLKWPTSKKHIIVFNEVNHAKEWGGEIDPAGYGDILEFASNWARSENENFEILPSAMDLASPNGSQTREAFNYLEQMYVSNNEIFDSIDAWNSHSYPNPGFASAPNRTGKNSLRGFLHELEYLKNKTGSDYKVYITETGWESNAKLARLLPSYYAYSLEKIWNHPQVVAVTPFLLKGAPGPFAGFSFLTDDDKPTPHYYALRRAIDKVYAEGEPEHLSGREDVKAPAL